MIIFAIIIVYKKIIHLNLKLDFFHFIRYSLTILNFLTDFTATFIGPTKNYAFVPKMNGPQRGGDQEYNIGEDDMNQTSIPAKQNGYKAPAVQKAFQLLRAVAESKQQFGLTDL